MYGCSGGRQQVGVQGGLREVEGGLCLVVSFGGLQEAIGGVLVEPGVTQEQGNGSQGLSLKSGGADYQGD